MRCFQGWNSTSKVTFTATGFPSLVAGLELPSAYCFDCPLVKAHSRSINDLRVGHISSSGHNRHHYHCGLILRLFRFRRFRADLWAGGIDRSRQADTSAPPGRRVPRSARLRCRRIYRGHSAQTKRRREPASRGLGNRLKPFVEEFA